MTLFTSLSMVLNLSAFSAIVALVVVFNTGGIRSPDWSHVAFHVGKQGVTVCYPCKNNIAC